MIQHILVIMPTEYIHSQALFETALSFSQALKSLGHAAEVTIDPSVVTGKTIVFGAHLLPKFGGTIEDGDYIIFNTEQVSSESAWIIPEYLDILKRYEVWDYSYNNIEALKGMGITARFCEIGYSPCLSNLRLGKSASITGGGTAQVKVDWVNSPSLSAPVGVFDVIFYGSVNERRKKIIDDLRATGLNVVTLTGYGAYRDKYISRAKIVLNMHYYDSSIFEIFRVSHLLANAKCVVSEVGNDQVIEDLYLDGVAFTEYGKIVETCLELLSDDKKREEIADAGFKAIKTRPQSDILKGLV